MSGRGLREGERKWKKEIHMFGYPKERGVVIKLITLNSKIPNTSWWACFHNL